MFLSWYRPTQTKQRIIYFSLCSDSSSGGPNQLGSSQKGPVWHGKVQSGPGQRGHHAEPHGLRPQGQRPLSAAAPVHLLPLGQRGGQHGRQLRQHGGGAALGDEVEDGAGRVHRGRSLPGWWRSGVQGAGAAVRERPEEQHHSGEGVVLEETPLCLSSRAGGTHQGESWEVELLFWSFRWSETRYSHEQTLQHTAARTALQSDICSIFSSLNRFIFDRIGRWNEINEKDMIKNSECHLIWFVDKKVRQITFLAGDSCQR